MSLPVADARVGNLVVVGTTEGQGAATFASSLTANSLVVTVDADVGGDLAVTGDLGVSGISTLDSLAVTNGATVGGSVTVTGNLDVTTGVSTTQDLVVEGLLEAQAGLDVTGTLNAGAIDASTVDATTVDAANIDVSGTVDATVLRATSRVLVETSAAATQWSQNSTLRSYRSNATDNYTQYMTSSTGDENSGTLMGTEGTTTIVRNLVEDAGMEFVVNDSGTTKRATLTRNCRWQDFQGFVTPVGVIMPYAGTSEPDGWFFCYGQAVSRTTYDELFSALGTTYGSGNGSTTFNLPDLRGRIPIGKTNMGGTTSARITTGGCGINGTTLGATGGTETVTLTVDEMPAHTHNVQGSAQVNPGTINRYGLGTSASTVSSSAGGGDAHRNVLPSLIVQYIVRY